VSPSDSSASSRMPALPEIPAILAALVEHTVSFLVIGGAAVAHHGFVRTTKDLDIVPEPSRANLACLWEALGEMNAQPLSLGDFRSDELPVPFTLEALCAGGNWDLATTYGRIDLLQYVEGKLEAPEDYERLNRRAEEARYHFGVVRYVSFDDLIDFKNIAGRDQDLIDIRALREARGDIA
jgi:hypothetical protein